jgi:hypothetical protein
VTDVWLLGRCKYKGGVKRFGGFLGGFLERARSLLGVSLDDPVLHVCGGLVRLYPYARGVGPNDRTLDLDPEVGPDYLQDAREPYPTGFRAILCDPPYGLDEADRYPPGYNTYPAPNLIVRLALNALPVGGRVGILHYVWPDAPDCAKETAAVAVGTGRNGRARWFIVFEKLAAPLVKTGSGAARRKRERAPARVPERLL